MPNESVVRTQPQARPRALLRPIRDRKYVRIITVFPPHGEPRVMATIPVSTEQVPCRAFGATALVPGGDLQDAQPGRAARHPESRATLVFPLALSAPRSFASR